MSSVPLASFLSLAAILFCLGLYGALTKRNTVIVLICIELMLNAVNINLIAFAKYGLYPDISGQVFTVFTISIGAASAAVGIAILIALFRNKETVNADEMNLMKR